MPIAGVNPSIQYTISQTGADNVKAKMMGIGGAMMQTSKVAKTQLQPSMQQNNMALMNMGRIAQDMPFGLMGISNNITFMAEQMTRAKEAGIGFKAQMLGMLKSLTGVGGLMFAISAFTSLLTILSMQSRGAGGELSSLTEQIKKLWSETFKASEKWREFLKEVDKLDFFQLKESIRAVNEEVEDFGVGFFQAGILALAGGKGINELRDKFQLLNDELKILKKQFEEGKTVGIVGRLEEQIKINKELRDSAETADDVRKYQGIVNQLQEQLNNLLKSDLSTRQEIKKVIEETIKITGKEAGIFPSTKEQINLEKFFGKKGIRKIGPADQFTDAMKAQLEKMDDMGEKIFQGWQGVLTSNMHQAWVTIFGDANSLFEQLVESMVQQIIDKMSGGIVGGILSFAGSFIPGVGGLIAGGAGRALSPNAPSTNKIVVQIGDQPIEELWLRGNQIARRKGYA